MDIIEFGQQQAAQLQSFADSFLKSVGAVQQQFFDKLNSLVSHLERDGELILANETNGKIVDEINNVLGAMLSESGYETAIVDFVSTFDKQKQLIDDYLSTQFDGTQNDFADAVFEQTKKSAVETLSSATPTTKFLQGIKSQIEIAVQSGSSFTKTVKDLRLYATGGLIDAGAQISGKDTPGVDGKLLQYSKQIAYDSIAISDRAYTNAIASGIDAEWYFFAGGILPSSRKFCIDRVGKYFHYKEIEDWANKEWQGKTENTNEQNIFILLGGHNCQHTLIPVSIDQVPTDVVQRNISNGNYKPEKKDSKEKQPPKSPPQKQPDVPTKQPVEKPMPVPKQQSGSSVKISDWKTWEKNSRVPDFATTSDAIEYFKNNLTKSLNQPYYEKFQPEQMTLIGKTMRSLGDGWSLRDLETMGKPKRERAMASAHGGTLNLNSMFISETRAKNMLERELNSREYNTNTLKSVREEIKTLVSEKEKIISEFSQPFFDAQYSYLNKKIKILEESEKHGRFTIAADAKTPSEYAQRIITHEYGHVVQYQWLKWRGADDWFVPDKIVNLSSQKVIDFIKSKNLGVEVMQTRERINNGAKILRERFIEMYKAIKKTDEKYLFGEYAYEFADGTEFFAESFAMYHFEKLKLPKKVVEYFDDLLEFIKKSESELSKFIPS